MTWNNVQPPCNTWVHCAQSSQDHRNHQCSTMPRAAYLHSQVAVLRQLLSMFLANVAIIRTADINKKTSVCLPISETDVWTIGFDLSGSGDGGIHLLCVVLNQISLVCKVYYKYRKQTLLQKYLDHHDCLERRHDFIIIIIIIIIIIKTTTTYTRPIYVVQRLFCSREPSCSRGLFCSYLLLFCSPGTILFTQFEPTVEEIILFTGDYPVHRRLFCTGVAVKRRLQSADCRLRNGDSGRLVSNSL